MKVAITETEGRHRRNPTATANLILQCEACDKPIVSLVVTDESASPLRYKAECPFCGDCSQVVRATGSARFMADRNVLVVDVECGDGGFLIKTQKENP